MLALAQRPVAPDAGRLDKAAELRFFHIVNAWGASARHELSIRPAPTELCAHGIDAILLTTRSYSNSKLLYKQTPVHLVVEYHEDSVELSCGMSVPVLPIDPRLTAIQLVTYVTHLLSRESVAYRDFTPQLKKLGFH